MDAGETEVQKLFGGHNASQHKDRINGLPGEILVHILSFLPMDEAVKTSILSKRWKYLWLSIPDFIFYDASWRWLENKTHDQALELKASFLDSIERALVRQNAQCLGKVFLSLQTDVTASRFSSWLSAMVERKVQKLDLCLKGEFVLPDSLFTSESLSRFYLQLHSVLKVPSFICFSSLKLLDLNGVVFHDDQSTQQLFSGCPVLEDLTLYDCHLKNLREITIKIPTLKLFTFSESRFFPDHYLGCKIIISAMKLEFIMVSGYLTIELLPWDLPCLNSATIDITEWAGGVDLSLRIVQLLSGLHNVKSLVLSRETLEHLRYDENIIGLLPRFDNLTNLGGLYQYPMYNDYASVALVYIVENSPKLESLCLPRGFKPGEEYMMLETVPQCFLSCLKRFHLSDFCGCTEDVSLLKHVYKNAPFLKQLSMDCSPKLTADFQKREEIHQQLRQVREGMGSCSIEFIPYVKW